MAHLFELYCEDRLIGKNKTATQIAELMGITVGQVTAYAKSGELINDRYRKSVRWIFTDYENL